MEVAVAVEIPELADYEIDAPIRAYLDRVIPGAYQEAIDQTWLNILRYYFSQVEFGLEREAYVSDPSDNKMKANISITNVVGGTLRQVLFVEAEKFPRNTKDNWPARYTMWNKHLTQLQEYMLESREAFGQIQTLYGIVAVGDVARFYKMELAANNPDGDLTLYQHRDLTGPTPITPVTLSIKTDGMKIQRVLRKIADDIVQEAAWLNA